jgi:hypothetical protein
MRRGKPDRYAQISRPGNQDARRQILTLDQCNWPNKTTTLKVLVQRSGMVVNVGSIAGIDGGGIE